MDLSYYQLIDTKLSEARAMDVIVSEDALTVDLEDGRTISVPVVWFPRLWHGTPEERNNWEINGVGWGIHWPDLDEDIGVKGLLIGNPSGESQRSFERWLEGREAQAKIKERVVLMVQPPKQAIVEEIRHQLMEDADRVLLNLMASDLSTYDYLQNSLLEIDVGTDRLYQRRFTSFFVPGPIARVRLNLFFSVLESEKHNAGVSFRQVLDRIYDETEYVEPSFSSKIVSLINPNLPVWDKKVLARLKLKPPYQSMRPNKRRMSKIIDLYSCIRELSTEIRGNREFESWRKRFDEAFPQFGHFTDVKKLDLYLWQKRG